MTKITKEFLDELEGFEDLTGMEEVEIISLAKKGIDYDALKSKLDKAVKCIEFYGDRKNWRYSGNDRFDSTFTKDDCELIITGKQRDNIGGKFARKTLKELNAN